MNRNAIRHNRRILVINSKNQLGAASKNMSDVTFFGNTFPTATDAIKFGENKFGKTAIPYAVKPINSVEPEPVKNVEPMAKKPVRKTTKAKEPLTVVMPNTKPKTILDLTVPELKAKCKEQGLTGYSKLAKPALLEMLKTVKKAA